MEKLKAIELAKTYRKEADDLLQRMKIHRDDMIRTNVCDAIDQKEVIAQHILSIRDLESAIMRQGMALKYIGNPDPYPESRNPDSPVVAPTADGLKM